MVGEGTGAVAAAIQSARSGASTILVSPQPWLGGMLTSAGVSATDGNHQLPAGLWGEFRQHLRNHYGGADSLFTGWVSNTMFEPHIGERYWQQMADKEENLTIYKNAFWTEIEKKKKWKVSVVLENGTLGKIRTTILVDGTDLGDVAAAAGATYDLGMDAHSKTGETMAPEQANDIVQDLTWAAILKDYGDSVDMTIPEPPDYQAADFYCSCKMEIELEGNSKLPSNLDCSKTTLHLCQTMLDYGKLPNGKYMINWPIHGNDFYANVAEMSEQEREVVYQKAKNHTLGFVYYIQTVLGYKNLGLAHDEFPTNDKLALMPYHREGRRIHGEVQMNVNHISKPYATDLYRTGIAVGDYPIDHHHYKNEKAPEIDFPKVPSFNIPMGCLIPKNIDDLLIADKAISVTNIVNGSSRLQPVIIQVGQAAGLMAAMSVEENISPKELNVRAVQHKLLAANGYLMPFIDVPPDDPHFAAVQRVGATGILKGRGVPYKWANQTWFDGDSTVLIKELINGLKLLNADFDIQLKNNKKFSDQILIIGDAVHIIHVFDKTISEIGIDGDWFEKNGLNNYDYNRPITKKELAVLLDKTIDPFNLISINLDGDFIENKN